MLDDHKNNLRTDKSIFLLPFSLIAGDHEAFYCINVQKIFSIIDLNEYSVLPGNIEPFAFLIDVQGMPIPVMNISDLIDHTNFDFNNKPKIVNSKKRIQSNKRIIICHFINIYIGIIVDSTKKIMIQSNENIQPPPQIWDNNEHFFVSGLIKENNHYRYLFDIEKYVYSKGINISVNKSDLINDYQILKNKNALIIEDSSLYQLMIKKVLEKYQVNIESAKDGKQGLQILLEKGDTFDFILSDIEMPYMNGLEMIRQYKQIKKINYLPVIFHSAITNPNLCLDISSENLGEYLSKFNEDELLKKIINLISKN